ncbi:hypothetical protein INT43_008795 [Umbelopsis isabellina]|uniref:Alpha/beta hydrolase fold-3 domain-containing protein n=1 Tax=Mortierella isabellina TaxID=91625 RepID=A0A8H7PVR1_MORIS|nr:hypothetical protein INT43_008795 [Umbelopsis isabellina]
MSLAYKKLAANIAYAAKLSRLGFGSPPKLSTAKTILETVWPSSSLVPRVIHDHYTKGPPAKSWSLEFHLAIAFMRDLLARSKYQTVEHMQWITSQIDVPLPPFTTGKPIVVPAIYRSRAGSILENAIDRQHYHDIGWNWREDKDKALDLSGEWLNYDGITPENKNESVVLYVHGGAGYLGSATTHRLLTSSIAKATGGSVYAINQRLAPQHPFPAPLEDALASYLQLIDQDGDYRIDPKNVIVAGESHGGGLIMALLLLLRDKQLPMPGGGMGLSPWIDMTHSLPSIMSNISTDYLPASGFSHKYSQALDYDKLPQFQAAALEPLEKVVSKDDSKILNEDLDRVQFYAPNAALKMRYVSPIFDELGFRGLPPLLLQVGTAERLRDESIYAAYKATNQYPSATVSNDGYFPTNVKLEMYVDQPHVFQMILSTVQRTIALKQMGKFVRSLVVKDVENQPAKYGQLEICTIQPDGKIVDGMTNAPDANVLKSWEQRLQRTSLRERLEEVHKAVQSLEH